MTNPLSVGDKLVRIQIFEVTDRRDSGPLVSVVSNGRRTDVGEGWLHEHCLPLDSEMAEVLVSKGLMT